MRHALLLETPPSFEHGEITDKGSINQRCVIARRGALVEALYERAGGDTAIDMETIG